MNAALEELKLSPRDPVIPVHVMTAWVNHYLGSVSKNKGMVRVERVKGKVSIIPQGGAGKEAKEALSSFDLKKAGALEAYLNFKTEVDRITGSKNMTREEKSAARAVNLDKAQAYEDELFTNFNKWLRDSEFIREVEEAYTWARGANIKPQGSSRPLHLPDWEGPVPHPYQAADVRVMAAAPGMINNYNVGLGKTYSMLLLVAYLKSCG